MCPYVCFCGVSVCVIVPVGVCPYVCLCVGVCVCVASVELPIPKVYRFFEKELPYYHYTLRRNGMSETEWNVCVRKLLSFLSVVNILANLKKFNSREEPRKRTMQSVNLSTNSGLQSATTMRTFKIHFFIRAIAVYKQLMLKPLKIYIR